MSKIKFGAFVTDMRGSTGGTVFSKNTYSAYTRNKVTPVNPNTVYQQAVRQFLTQISQGWSGLTAAERVQWNTQAPNWSRTNVFGDDAPLSGFNLFMKLNLNRLIINEAIITAPPLQDDVFGFTSATLAINVGAATADITFAPAIDASTKVILEATSPQSPGVNFVKQEFRVIKILDNGDASPFNMASDYVAKFGVAGIVNSKIFIQMKPINIATGQAGTTISAFAIAT